MQLADWLKRHQMTQERFGELIGSSQPQVARFAAGTRIPNRQVMRAILRTTKGQVRPDDFYAVTEKAAAG